MGDQQIAFVSGLLVFGLMLGTVLAVAALIDAYRRKKSPGPHRPKKLTRREIFWGIIIVMLLFLLGIPLKYSALD